MEWYISWEQGLLAGSWSIEEQEAFARLLVEELDDAWSWAIFWWVHVYRTSFGTGDILRLGAEPYTISSGTKEIASLLRVQLTSAWLWIPNGTSTQPYLDTDPVLQDNAPFPASLYGERFWHEKLWGSSTQRNAARFSIASGVDVKGFGVWIGDLETRTDGEWWPWEILLFDDEGVVLDRQQIAADDTDSISCWSEDILWGCGNQSTRWVWFLVPDDVSDRVAHIVISVGDDDVWDDQNTIWTTEHFSLIWPTFVFACDDTDIDGVCDQDDVCPDDPEKSSGLWCGCTVTDPSNYWTSCVSEANSCGIVGTGTVQCNGTCSAELPVLVENYNDVCTSSENSCGLTATGTVACDGQCSANIPSQTLCADTSTWDSWWGWWASDWTTDTEGDTSTTNTQAQSGSWSQVTDDETQDTSGSWFVLPDWLPDTWAIL